ncbi:MAG: hypothetical protein BGP12_02180 [Rhodospirillales bacterium 70-18]|nr:MAG: hypothetical protein BGP12_02180 [Rhodospirillales bacterium 70-18]
MTVTLALALTFGGGFPGVNVAHAQIVAQDTVDPPARVGRLARLLGTVSFHTADEGSWQAAMLNYPVTSGNAFWTEPSSGAEIEVGPTHLALDQSTELDIDVLDDHTLEATQPQGALFLRLRSVPPGDSYRITTPRGVVVIGQAGAYEVVAGDDDHPTIVNVVEGAARIDSPSASLSLGARQSGRIDGSSTFAISVGPVISDPFLAARLAQEQQAARPVVVARVAPPPMVAQMTGGAVLDSVGVWASSPRYGHIWYPPVQASWVPYRNGHWGYVAPWGWTWIDDAEWGFAPFHYGRWVQDGPRWGWIPAEPGAPPQQLRAMPVYAPALVTFVGIGIAIGAALAPGTARNGRDGEHGSVGWIPLGPREAYVPPYHASERYVRAVNVTNVTNVRTITNVTNVTTVNNYINRSAVTVVPAAAVAASQQVAARVQPVTARELAASRPQRAAPVQPTVATVGVTPTVAKRLNLAPAPASATAPQQRRVAPGPALPPPAAVAPASTTPAMVPPGGAGKAVPGAGTPPAGTPARPGAATRPGAPARPAAGLPAAAALPVLRPATPITPPHPKAGGTAVGAIPPAKPVTPTVPVPSAGVPGTPPAAAPGRPAPAPTPGPATAAPRPATAPPAVTGPAAPKPSGQPAAPAAAPRATPPTGPMAPHPATTPPAVTGPVVPKPAERPAAKPPAPAAAPHATPPTGPMAPHPATTPPAVAAPVVPKPAERPVAKPPAPAAAPHATPPAGPMAPHPAATSPAATSPVVPKPAEHPVAKPPAPAAAPHATPPAGPMAPHPGAAPPAANPDEPGKKRPEPPAAAPAKP